MSHEGPAGLDNYSPSHFLRKKARMNGKLLITSGLFLPVITRSCQADMTWPALITQTQDQDYVKDSETCRNLISVFLLSFAIIVLDPYGESCRSGADVPPFPL